MSRLLSESLDEYVGDMLEGVEAWCYSLRLAVERGAPSPCAYWDRDFARSLHCEEVSRQLTKDLNLRFASPTSLRFLRELEVPLDAELGPALPQPLAEEGSVRRAIGQLKRCADEVERRSRRELVRTVAQEHVQAEVRAAQDAEFAKEYRTTKLRLNPVIGLTDEQQRYLIQLAARAGTPLRSPMSSGTTDADVLRQAQSGKTPGQSLLSTSSSSFGADAEDFLLDPPVLSAADLAQALTIRVEDTIAWLSMRSFFCEAPLRVQAAELRLDLVHALRHPDSTQSVLLNPSERVRQMARQAMFGLVKAFEAHLSTLAYIDYYRRRKACKYWDRNARKTRHQLLSKLYSDLDERWEKDQQEEPDDTAAGSAAAAVGSSEATADAARSSSSSNSIDAYAIVEEKIAAAAAAAARGSAPTASVVPSPSRTRVSSSRALSNTSSGSTSLFSSDKSKSQRKSKCGFAEGDENESADTDGMKMEGEEEEDEKEEEEEEEDDRDDNNDGAEDKTLSLTMTIWIWTTKTKTKTKTKTMMMMLITMTKMRMMMRMTTRTLTTKMTKVCFALAEVNEQGVAQAGAAAVRAPTRDTFPRLSSRIARTLVATSRRLSSSSPTGLPRLEAVVSEAPAMPVCRRGRRTRRRRSGSAASLISCEPVQSQALALRQVHPHLHPLELQGLSHPQARHPSHLVFLRLRLQLL